MKNILVEEKDNLYSLAEKIKNSEDSEITLDLRGTPTFMYGDLSMKFLEKIALKENKSLTYDFGRKQINSPIKTLEKIEQKETEVVVSESTAIPKSALKASILLVAILVVVLLLGSASFLLIPSATVEATLNTQTIAKNLDLIAKTNQEKYEPSSNSIPGVLLESTRKATNSVESSGKREVGEKATGVIKIFNKTTKKQSFEKGTKLTLVSTSKDNLNFILLENVAIEERKEDATDPTKIVTTYGTAEAKIEAEKYGKDYNVDANENFKVDKMDIDEVVGQNEKAVEGGSSKIVPSVTEGDKKSLKDNLENQLKIATKGDLELKLVADQKIAENSAGYEVIEETYDKNVGDEADRLNLTMQIKAYSIAYHEKDLNTAATDLMKKSVPENYALRGSDTQFEVANVIADSPTPTTKDQLKLLVKTRASVIPKVSKEEMASSLAGKSLKDAKNYLDSFGEIEAYDIEINPSFMRVFGIMPKIKSRISVVIKGT